MSLPGSLQELVEQLKQLPGVGAKSAQRLAFHILRTPREDTDRLCQAIRDVKDRVTYCSICNNITDADPCQMCGDEGRDHRIICVVEEPQNVSVVDRTGGFRGRYHVLMGTISPLQGVGPDDLKIKGLLAGGPQDVEGEALRAFRADAGKPLQLLDQSRERIRQQHA